MLLNLPFNKYKAYHYSGVVDVPVTQEINPETGLFVAAYNLNKVLEVQKLNANSGYVVTSFSFSLNCPESEFQSGIFAPIQFQFKNGDTGSLLLPDTYKAVTYIRQFESARVFSVENANQLNFSSRGLLIQHEGLASYEELKLLISFLFYEVTDQDLVARYLGK